MSRLISGSVAVALACASATAVVHVQSDGAVPAFSRTELVPPPMAGWPTNGGNLSNQRYSPLTEINRENVARLKGVWRTRLRGSGLGPQYSGEAQPLVYDGVIYIVTGADDVFAVGVETGNILWEYKANLDPAIDSVCCGWTSRGVGLGDGKVFVGQLDGRLVALDQRTGTVAWSIQAERWQEGFTIPSAPLYYDGLVITGFAGAEKGIRGRVKAYNAKDGALVWTFYTIPGPGEPGHETWPKDNDLWQDGGASVWHTPAVDPELGLLYFGTGNPGPDYNGLVRKGDNLFSVVDGGHRCEDRQVPLALPARAPRHLGLRRGHAARAVRSHDQRATAQGPRASEQDRLGLHSRPGDRETPDRHRRARRAAGASPGHGRDAALSARRRLRAPIDRHRARRARRSSTRDASSRRSGRRRCR